MKQIDKLLAVSFIGPFTVAFGIALFAFLMQFLWVYIDEIIGKGAGPLLIVELVGYLSVSLVPKTLPVAVLIASVMTLGNLAEHYELASMKSAGIPLLRVMMPLVLCCLVIAGFSFTCSNYLIPVANLKARTRLYDIRKQKPSLSLEEGAFNDDFQGFSIRIGKKDQDGRGLEDVMLFRQGSNLRGRLESVNAERGLMDITSDERYFVLALEDGYQYQEPEQELGARRLTYPFVRTKFATYRKSFDLSEFEITQTDESALESRESMLSAAQLGRAADSIRIAMNRSRERLSTEVGRYITPIRKLDRVRQLEQERATRAGEHSSSRAVDSVATSKRRINGSSRTMLPDGTPANYAQFISLQPEYKLSSYANRALGFIRSISGYAEGAESRLTGQRDSLIRHVYERNAKFSLAAACIVFLFIGAPMGAIIRKGGFGYPILVSIIFFMAFTVLGILCKKLMESYSMEPAVAAWAPTAVIFPIGIMLTYKAMNDTSFALLERVQTAGKRLWRRVPRRLKRALTT